MSLHKMFFRIISFVTASLPQKTVSNCISKSTPYFPKLSPSSLDMMSVRAISTALMEYLESRLNSSLGTSPQGSEGFLMLNTQFCCLQTFGHQSEMNRLVFAMSDQPLLHSKLRTLGTFGIIDAKKTIVRNYCGSNNNPTDCLWCKSPLSATSRCKVNFCANLPPFETLFLAMLVYEQKNRIPCHECLKKDGSTKYFSCPTSLKEHYSKSHEEFLNWPELCKRACGARFRNTADLDEHMLFCPCKTKETATSRRARFAQERTNAEKVLYKLRMLGYTPLSGPNE